MSPSFFTLHSSLSILRRSFLIVVTVAYLLGQVCAAWGWSAFTPLWLGVFAVLSLAVWFCGGWRLAALVGCLLCAFSLANSALQRVFTPHFPPAHLRHLSLPQEVTIEGWLFREPERFPHRSHRCLPSRSGLRGMGLGRLLAAVAEPVCSAESRGLVLRRLATGDAHRVLALRFFSGQ